MNYRGSTGFGREYREKLDGEWGVVDVDDAVAAAEYLASIGEADGDRRATSGGSAGGYTTLAALAFRDTFSAGASFYGIADIEMLMGDRHKLESRYETRLVGSDLAVWRERSPIHSVDEIDVPVALYQGLDDKIVPPNQAVVVAQALADRGIPFVHVEYEGEGHGFRQAETVVHSLETELAFYGKVFDFTPAGDLPEIDMAGKERSAGGKTPGGAFPPSVLPGLGARAGVAIHELLLDVHGLPVRRQHADQSIGVLQQLEMHEVDGVAKAVLSDPMPEDRALRPIDGDEALEHLARARIGNVEDRLCTRLYLFGANPSGHHRPVGELHIVRIRRHQGVDILGEERLRVGLLCGSGLLDRGRFVGCVGRTRCCQQREDCDQQDGFDRCSHLTPPGWVD